MTQLKYSGLLAGDVLRVQVELTIFAPPQSCLTFTTSVVSSPGDDPVSVIVDPKILEMVTISGTPKDQNGNGAGAIQPNAIYTVTTTGWPTEIMRPSGSSRFRAVVTSGRNCVTDFVRRPFVAILLRWTLALAALYCFYLLVRRFF